MYFAWDVSTSVIGVCLLDGEGLALEFSFLEPGKFDGMPRKYEYVLREIPALIERWCLKHGVAQDECHHFIEDRLGNFSKGATRLQTLMMLSAMNAVVTGCIIGHVPADPARVTHILPNVAKKWAGLKVPKGGDKKKYAVEMARSYSSIFPYALTLKGKHKKGVEDMADALVTGIAGIRMKKNGALNTGKVKAPKKVSRRAKDREEGQGGARLPVPVL